MSTADLHHTGKVPTSKLFDDSILTLVAKPPCQPKAQVLGGAVTRLPGRQLGNEAVAGEKSQFHQ